MSDPEWPYIAICVVWLIIAIWAYIDHVSVMPYVYAGTLTNIAWRLVRIEHAIRERKRDDGTR